MGGAAAGAAAGAMARARRRLIAHFRDAGATSAASAVDYAPERGIERRLLAKMVDKGVLHQTAPHTYWIDLDELKLWTRSRRRRAGALIGAAAAIGAAIGLIAGSAG